MMRRVRGALTDHREVAIIGAAAVGIVGFANLTPPLAGPEVAAWLRPVTALDGDLPQYVWRFVVSAAFLGVLPCAVCVAFGIRAEGLGLATPKRVLPRWVWFLVGVGCVAAAVGVAYTPSTFAYYPYSKTLVERVAAGGLWPFALHSALYLFLYYVPWEILFRGILLFPLVRLAPLASRSSLYAIASLQAIPSALLHIGHPAAESFAAIVFGVGAGVLALESRSIYPGLAVHAGIGILADLFIVLRLTGALP